MRCLKCFCQITPGTTKCPDCETNDPYTPKETYSDEEMRGIKMMGLKIPIRPPYRIQKGRSV